MMKSFVPSRGNPKRSPSPLSILVGVITESGV